MSDKNKVLKQYFGYDSFREGQEEIVDQILNGMDVFGIMPTGAGKSICYQVPALLLSGITLVISPLISLMKDQVSALNQAGIYAAFLNSSLNQKQYFKALDFAKAGKYKIIYVAPERLLTDSFLEFAMNATISFVSVDEAHCVSQWGQDFRPSYLKITEFIDRLPNRPILGAFTATATDVVKEDVVKILKLRSPHMVATGFDRPNLKFVVETPPDKYAFLSRYLKEHGEENGIIYCISRKLVEEVCDRLHGEGYQVTRYHAGLSDEERRLNQEEFIYDRAKIMVATNAFGMGIDKSDVRYVIHYNMPKNVESYYQEAGRAGRDGGDAECILLYSGQDVRTNEFFIENNRDNEELEGPDLERVRAKDRERLKKMTFYCFTKDCLREYILKYFGEYKGNYCGNCSNCLTNFETEDVILITRNIIGCIEECEERFGMTLILDILRGAATERIKKFHLQQNEYYGRNAETSLVKLRQIMNEMLLQNYLGITNDQYPTVYLTDLSRELYTEGTAFWMKFVKEEERYQPKLKKLGKKSTSSFQVENEELFQKLRSLRSELSAKEKVPAYIIFTDKTLIDMSNRIPKNKEEMLEVSGVAQAKYEKYGEAFLAEVESYRARSPKVRVK